MNPDALDAICSRNTINGIYLMPSCANPTAIEMPTERRDKLSYLIAKHDLICIEDDSYRFLTDCKAPSFYELLPTQTIYISSTSKSLCAGVRVAIMAFPIRYKSNIQNAFRSTNLHMSSIDTEITIELINSGYYKNIFETIKKKSLHRNRIYNQIFKERGTSLNHYSYFRWLEIPLGSDNIIKSLEDMGTQVMHSSVFNAGFSNEKDYIRIALSSVIDDNLLKYALEKHILQMIAIP